MWPVESQPKQCSSSSSDSGFIRGLSQPGWGRRLQLARGMPWSPTFQMSILSLVAPARNAPSGVNASATIAGPIVIEHFAAPSVASAFHMNIAPSSPPDANNLSVSITGGCVGCQANAVTASQWASIERRLPELSHT